MIVVIEQSLLVISLLTTLVAIISNRWRRLLAGHFYFDHFAVLIVWLYSAPELPRYLKIANLWGSDAELGSAGICQGFA